MTTLEFRAARGRVLAGAQKRATAVMCAEAVPWRCHRQLIADAAAAGGWTVVHVLSATRAEPLALHRTARVRADGTVV